MMEIMVRWTGGLLTYATLGILLSAAPLIGEQWQEYRRRVPMFVLRLKQSRR